MSVYIAYTNASLAAAPGKLGNVPLPSDAGLAILGLEPAAWFRGLDAAVAPDFTWSDRIGGVVAVPTQSGFQPTLTEKNGKQVVKFNTAGVNIDPIIPVSGPYTFLFVGDLASANHGILGDGGATGMQINVNTNSQINVRHTSSGTVVTSPVIVVAGQPAAYAVSWDGANTIAISKNGVVVGTGTISDVPVLPAKQILGARTGNTSFGLNVPVYDVLTFRKNLHAAGYSAELGWLVQTLRDFYAI